MEKIPCSVIQDLLPLYLEEAVSRETKDAVQAHLQNCTDCRKEAELLQRQVVLPSNIEARAQDTAPLYRIKRTLCRKRVLMALLTAALCATLLIGGGALAVVVDWEIPYQEEQMALKEQEGTLYVQYLPADQSLFSGWLPFEVVLDGEQKTVAVFCYMQSFWSKYIQPKQEATLFPIVQTDEVDAVYYGPTALPIPGEQTLAEAFQENLDQYQLVWKK